MLIVLLVAFVLVEISFVAEMVIAAADVVVIFATKLNVPVLIVIEPALVIAAFTFIVGVVLLSVLLPFKTSALEEVLVIAALIVVLPALMVSGPDAK